MSRQTNAAPEINLSTLRSKGASWTRTHTGLAFSANSVSILSTVQCHVQSTKFSDCQVFWSSIFANTWLQGQCEEKLDCISIYLSPTLLSPGSLVLSLFPDSFLPNPGKYWIVLLLFFPFPSLSLKVCWILQDENQHLHPILLTRVDWFPYPFIFSYCTFLYQTSCDKPVHNNSWVMRQIISITSQKGDVFSTKSWAFQVWLLTNQSCPCLF